jgi:hypothetical protein
MVSIASMTMFSGIALPAAAEEPVYDAAYCLATPRLIARHYYWKNPDSVEVKKIEGYLFEVTVRKDGKKGIYEFDGCTRQSRKIR